MYYMFILSDLTRGSVGSDVPLWALLIMVIGAITLLLALTVPPVFDLSIKWCMVLLLTSLWIMDIGMIFMNLIGGIVIGVVILIMTIFTVFAKRIFKEIPGGNN